MKRTASNGGIPHIKPFTAEQTTGIKPARNYEGLGLASASQMAMEILNSLKPEAIEFGYLLDAMFDQDIRTLKLAGPLNAKGYQALMQELMRNEFRLKQQIRGLDLSCSTMPRISALLELVVANGDLTSLNLAGTKFYILDDMSMETEAPPLQPPHLHLVADIVRKHKELTFLDLSGQRGLSQAVLTRNRFLEAPLEDLMQACRSSKLQVLKLCNCHFEAEDLTHVFQWLQSEAQADSTPSLLELDLRANPHNLPWKQIFRSLRGHKSLEKLYLPNEAADWWIHLKEEEKAEVVKNLETCPQLHVLEPLTLACAEGIHELLKARDPFKVQMELMTAALVIGDYEEMTTDLVGLCLRTIAQHGNKNLNRVLPTRFVLSAALDPKHNPR